MKEFYLKEIVMRSFFGFMIGCGLAIYFYGGKKAPQSLKEEKIEDKESLDYSALKKKKFQSSLDLFPGKIRKD